MEKQVQDTESLEPTEVIELFGGEAFSEYSWSDIVQLEFYEEDGNVYATYLIEGMILQSKAEKGKWVFRDKVVIDYETVKDIYSNRVEDIGIAGKNIYFQGYTENSGLRNELVEVITDNQGNVIEQNTRASDVSVSCNFFKTINSARGHGVRVGGNFYVPNEEPIPYIDPYDAIDNPEYVDFEKGYVFGRKLFERLQWTIRINLTDGEPLYTNDEAGDKTTIIRGDEIFGDGNYLYVTQVYPKNEPFGAVAVPKFGYFDYELDGFNIVDHPIPIDIIKKHSEYTTFTKNDIHMWVPNDYKRGVGVDLITINKPH
ncbi:hypothetical protein I7V34_14685 [Bacillus sp. V3]|nr:hypothetical protein I7V34_14685 [Bacillus sp. V3]